MSSRVILDVTEYGENARTYVFEEPQLCLVGRAPSCHIQISAVGHMQVSRHHCLFEIDPPLVRIRDLHSKNGTYVNGERVEYVADLADPLDAPGTNLKDGDIVLVGNAIVRVTVEAPMPVGHAEEYSWSN